MQSTTSYFKESAKPHQEIDQTSYFHMTRRERDPLVVGRVVGDVLDNFIRSIDLTVSYNDTVVTNGCELKPSQVVSQPRVDVGGDDLRAFHTLVRLVPFSLFIILLYSLSRIFFLQLNPLFETITKILLLLDCLYSFRSW